MKRIALSFLIFIAILLASCTEKIRIQNNAPIYALNTTIDVTFYNVDNYEKHYQKIKQIYNDVNRISNDFESNYNGTSVYDLNQKRSIEASPMLIDLVNKAIDFMKLSDGYYNPFIGRISHIWKNVLQTKILPDENLIAEELQIMNSTSIEIANNKISLIGEGNLDLGGIAKGYATELVYNYLKENNISGYLINAGNSSIALGTKANASFRLGLINPNTNNYYAYLKLKNNNIATSSPQHQQTVIDDKIYHHLINPKTGYPSNIYSALSLVGSDNIMLDVLSTAMFSMKLEDIKKFEKKFDVKAILLKDNTILYVNDGCDFFEKA